ncbi:MAG: Asp-tRNA(Asn)/Glu-tRNA(Gln) amidotransferase subunit GatB [Planctomycetia bacterium]|jgi:aspartyl-tRNA(Asn)/glutamyl-tRNA(Gln) amidotransferase subunit B
MYDIIIGLEVHVQLATESKLFCGCSTRFGAEPNTQTCPVCIGMPGVLPVMNRRAFELGLKTAVALNCTIPRFTKWDRKQYYYPDLPKAYQISQFDLPMSEDGHLEISDPKGRFETKRIGIIRAHLEEDAGKSMHDEVEGKADSRIDLNRTGTPLLEIVSQPDLRSPAEAKAYLTELKLLLTYLGVSDCNMQEGSLRVDANINLHVHVDEADAADTISTSTSDMQKGTLKVDKGKIATPIVEVKNMNSFRAVERALTYEAERQWEVWKKTGRRLGDVPKQTRGWDEADQITRGQRSKEESSDYRYFPDPDLVPVTTTEEEVEAIRAGLGELPAALRTRLEADYEITPYDADVLVNQGRELVDYFIAVADTCKDGKAAANWIQQDVLRTLNDREIPIGDFSVPAEQLAQLLQEVAAGKLTTSRGREVLAEMIESTSTIETAMKKLGIEAVDDSALETLCRELLAANPKIVEEVKEGKMKAAGALIGQAKQKNPNVNPAQVRDLCLKLIEQMK